MSYIRAILVLAVVIICSMDSVQSRPRAHIVGNHIMKHDKTVEKQITSNKIGKRWREPKRLRHNNRALLKSLLAFEEELYDEYEQYEYEEDYEYESPIIEIRFKREAPSSPLANSLLVNKMQAN